MGVTVIRLEKLGSGLGTGIRTRKVDDIQLLNISTKMNVLLTFGGHAPSASCSNVHSYGCWQLPPQLHKPVHAKLAFMHLHLPLHDALHPHRMSS